MDPESTVMPKGSGLSSGTGSTVTYTVPPEGLSGKVTPSGALIRKSSPGKPGASLSEYRRFSSRRFVWRKYPVDNRAPPTSTHPS